jgi:hypothetical protein
MTDRGNPAHEALDQAAPGPSGADAGGPQVAQEIRPRLYGLLAEFPGIDSVIKAAEHLREQGFRRFDVHSPFPIHGIDRAMGVRATRLPWLVFLGGISGTGLGVLLVWFTNAFDYPFLISGKPIFSLQANIPVIFETTVLLAAFVAVIGMLLLNKLPMLYNPLFKHERFRRVTTDGFFVVVRADDPRFDIERTTGILQSLGAVDVEEVED